MADGMEQMVDALAAKHMGYQPQAEPQAPPQQAPQQQAPQQQAPQQAQPAKKDTAEDQASEQGAPDTEAQEMAKDPILYEVAFGEQTRKLTPEQIASTFDRYSKLNHRHAMLSPVNNVIDKIMKDNPDMNPQQLAEKMEALYAAQASNAQMGEGAQNTPQQGQQPQGNQNQSNEDISAQLSAWEEENAVSLPPGYKDAILNGNQSMSQIQQQLAQTQQMLQMVLAQSQGVADAAKQGVSNAQGQQVNAIRQTIANNVDRAQAALQLPDDAANDFMTFATERGYTLEDFADPQLTLKVMTDFRNNMHSPEMERLRKIAQRRQAYTGHLGSAPSAGQAPQAEGPAADPEFNSIVEGAMSKRML